MSEDDKRLLYVCLQEELPRFVIQRLRLAHGQGLKATIALSISSLYSPEILNVLAEIDGDVFVVDDFITERRFAPRHFLAAIADIEVPLAPAVRRFIAQNSWVSIEDGSSIEKGRRLEAFLSFLFSQVRDFKVVERNYRNVSEEIDLILQVDNFSNRSWQNPSAPFILVEAKNRADKASQQMMSVLLTKLQTKRGTAKIGIMVSLGGFTEDARMQELRFSTQDICVVMLDRLSIEQLLAVDDLDEALDTMVRRSLVR